MPATDLSMHNEPLHFHSSCLPHKTFLDSPEFNEECGSEGNQEIDGGLELDISTRHIIDVAIMRATDLSVHHEPLHFLASCLPHKTFLDSSEFNEECRSEGGQELFMDNSTSSFPLLLLSS